MWIARRMGFTDVERRVYGPELMAACLDAGRERGIRHYLFGSTPQTLRHLQEAIEERWPGAEVVGKHAPPFRALSRAEIEAAASEIESAGAQLVWVGLGTPRQDLVVDQLAGAGSAVFVAIGAAFDFISGGKPQAPRWMREHGLEWLFRLLSEPRRLAGRYLLGNARFLYGILRDGPVRVERAGSRPGVVDPTKGLMASSEPLADPRPGSRSSRSSAPLDPR